MSIPRFSGVSFFSLIKDHIPTAAKLASRHLAHTLREKRTRRLQVLSTFLMASGPAVLPAIFSLLVWLQPGIPAALQVSILMILHGWSMIWLLCNQDGLTPHQDCHWSHSFSCTGYVRRWTAWAQNILLHKHLITLTVLLAITAYFIPIDESISSPDENENIAIVYRTLIVSAFLLIGQWMHLARIPYGLNALLILACGMGLFYGGLLLGSIVGLLQFMVGWLVTEYYPLKPTLVPNDQKWLKFPLQVRMIVGATRKNPALWVFPMALLSLMSLYFFAILYFNFQQNTHTGLLCQLLTSLLIIGITWSARQQWLKTLEIEGGFKKSLPSLSFAWANASNLLFIFGIVILIIIWGAPMGS